MAALTNIFENLVNDYTYTFVDGDRYDYESAIKSDICDALASGDYDYILEDLEIVDAETLAENIDELQSKLYDEFFTDDHITGNASGSYTFNAWKAESYILHNFDLLADAFDEFGGSFEALREGAESCDVTIRCYLLGGALAEIMEELENLV